jgi:hypothetical protein
MADIFGLVGPDDRSIDDVIAENGEAAETAPTYFFALLAIELAVSALCLLPGTKVIHVVGYLIAAVFVAVTVVMFRSVDRVRRRSNRYISYTWPGRTAGAALGCGLVLAMLHAYYFAQSRQIAP